MPINGSNSNKCLCLMQYKSKAFSAAAFVDTLSLLFKHKRMICHLFALHCHHDKCGWIFNRVRLLFRTEFMTPLRQNGSSAPQSPTGKKGLEDMPDCLTRYGLVVWFQTALIRPGNPLSDIRADLCRCF